MLDMDYSLVARRIASFISDYVGQSGAEGVVIGLSGGVDSSVAATLCVRALGNERVLGLVMPTQFTPTEDVEDARWLAGWLNVKHKTIPIDPIVEGYGRQLGHSPDSQQLKMPFANLRARVRMSLLYFHANTHKLLVAGTGDRSESAIAYFTKWGDGGVDLLPLGSLFKSQVRRLGLHLGLPGRIAYKPSSPQLYPGHRATDEIPLDYDDLDVVLYLLLDKNMTAEEVSAETGIQLDAVRAVLSLHRRTGHKRAMPPTPPL